MISSDEHERQADEHAQLDMWELAARSYIQAIKIQPHVARLHRKLADLQRRSGDFAGASQSYRRAVKLEQAASQTNYSRLAPTASAEVAQAYLELLKSSLTFQLWEGSDGSLFELNASKPMVSFVRIFQRIKQKFNPASADVREFGLDWPAQALTMVGNARLDNLQLCAEQILADKVPGDFIETGVWRGGCTIFMRALLKAYGDQDRSVWVADSFCGLPKPNVDQYPADRKFDLSMWRSLAVSVDEVRANFQRFQLLDARVKFLQGWFSETLPQAPIQQLSLMRLDGDLYESTMDGLKHLYAKLSPGGFVIIDDYFCSPPCKQAVDDFRSNHNILEEMVTIDWSAIYWRKQ